MKRFLRWLLCSKLVQNWYHRRRLQRQAKKIGREVAADLRTDVLRKIPTSSASEFAEYVQIRACQAVHARVDRLLKTEQPEQLEQGNQLILTATERASAILNRTYPTRNNRSRSKFDRAA